MSTLLCNPQGSDHERIMDMPLMESDQTRPTSWVATENEVETYRQRAWQLVGQRILEVRYYEIDYFRWDLHPELVDAGPRIISDRSEWENPTWRCPGFASIDYGIEIATEDSLVFSLAWDSPGKHEGISLEPVPMLGRGVSANADVAIWNVIHMPPWTYLGTMPIAAVDLCYRPCGEEAGFWCPRITLRTREVNVEIILADHNGELLVPSADNIAILHPETPLPDWAL